MKLDPKGLDWLEKRIETKPLDEVKAYYDKEHDRYSKFYVFTAFLNLVVISLAFIAGAYNGGVWQAAFLIVGLIYVFVYIALGDKSKGLAYDFAIYYKKLRETKNISTSHKKL